VHVHHRDRTREGLAKRGDEWFPLSQAVVAYDMRAMHRWATSSRSTSSTRTSTLVRGRDRADAGDGKELHAALDRAITAAEFEEAEVRGKGVALSLVRAA